MIRKNKKVILSVPGEEIAGAVLGCGSTSGRNTDKIAKFNIELDEINGCDIKIPLHSRLALVCDLKEFIETGDHYLYICNVTNVFGNEAEKALFAWNGYSKIRPAE